MHVVSVCPCLGVCVCKESSLSHAISAFKKVVVRVGGRERGKAMSKEIFLLGVEGGCPSFPSRVARELVEVLAPVVPPAVEDVGPHLGPVLLVDALCAQGAVAPVDN